MTLYVFGNEYLDDDSMAARVAKHLDVAVVHCRSPEELLDVDDDPIRILDVVKDVSEPILIEDVERLKTRGLVSLHDLDLGYFLTLMAAMGQPKTVRIIGVPAEGDPHGYAQQVKEWI